MTVEGPKYDAHDEDDCPHTTCETCVNKFTQLMPAPGWLAWYVEDDNSLFSLPLVAWALERDGMTVTPLVWMEGLVQDANMVNLVSVMRKNDGQPEADDVSEAKLRAVAVSQIRAEQLKADNKMS